MARYYIDVEHRGLHKVQRISGNDPVVVEMRAAAKRREWDAQWRRQQEAAHRRRKSEEARQDKERRREEDRANREARKAEAERLTAESEAAIDACRSILAHTLRIDDRINFDALKSHLSFEEPEPTPPPPVAVPEEPVFSPRRFVAEPPSFWRLLWERLSPQARADRESAERSAALQFAQSEENEYQVSHTEWIGVCSEVARRNEALRVAFEAAWTDWGARKREFELRQARDNERVDELHRLYLKREGDAVEQYCDLVLSNSQYPDCFPKTYDIAYQQESRMLVVEYVMPTCDVLPSIKAVRYVASRDEMEEIQIAETARVKLYDEVVYQVVIRTIHELFEADVANALDAVAFNGVLDTIDPATGKNIRPCIATVQATKKEFLEFDLARVQPKACFRKLKGLAGPELAAVTPVAPVVRLPTRDERYVDGRAVLESVEETTNLAAMPWEDFEHLIRQLFEREFAASGAEVKVTRTSRDGGVDAVILDPDPIRGGKFVVQAKRYTNTVSVSAVRDLYGTMLNEGAVKGILVTTSQLGPDAYAFAQDKPLTLIDGANLLFLLQKHGTKACIDVAAAKSAASGAAS